MKATKFFIVIETDVLAESDFVHDRAYATEHQAERRIERLKLRENSEYSRFRVKEIIVHLPLIKGVEVSAFWGYWADAISKDIIAQNNKAHPA